MNNKPCFSLTDIVEISLQQVVSCLKNEIENNNSTNNQPDWQSINCLIDCRFPLFISKKESIQWANSPMQDILIENSIISEIQIFTNCHKFEIETLQKLNIKLNYEISSSHFLIQINNEILFYFINQLSNNYRLVSIIRLKDYSFLFNKQYVNAIYFEKLFNSTNEIFFILDQNCQFVVKNNAFKEFQKKINPNQDIEMTDKLMLLEIKQHGETAFSENKHIELKTTEILSGKIFHLRRDYTPFTIENEKFILGHFQDTTTEITNKYKLKKEIGFLNKFLENTRIGYLFFNHSNELIAFNNKAKELLAPLEIRMNIKLENLIKNGILYFTEEETNSLLNDVTLEIIEIKLKNSTDTKYLKFTKTNISHRSQKYMTYAIEDITELKKQTLELQIQNKFLKQLAEIGSRIATISNHVELYKQYNKVLYNALLHNCIIASFQVKNQNELNLDYIYIGDNYQEMNQQVDAITKCAISLIECEALRLKHDGNLFELADKTALNKKLEECKIKLPLKSNQNSYLTRLVNNEKEHYCSLIITNEISKSLALDFFKSITNQFNSRLLSIAQMEEINSQKENAIRLNNAKSAFVSNITHEIKNPMNAILGFTKLLEKRIENPKNKEFVTIIRKNSEQLLTIVQDLSDISKIESNTLTISLEKTDLLAVIKELHELYQNFLEINPNVSLQFNFNYQESIFVLADFLRLKQILLNLISNALKYTPKGTIELGFEKHPNQITIYVKDTGIGIASENIDKIFQRYKREKNNLNKTEGVGIGLSIAQEFALKMNSKINVESKVNEGSKFYLTLEIFKDEPIIKQDELKTKQLESENKHLMIIEDNEFTIKFYEYYLSELDIEFSIYNSALKAEQALEKFSPQLIFSDIRMPQKNGLQFARDNQAKLSQIPLYFITADKSEEILEQAKNVGCTDILYKPIETEKIHNLLIKHGFKLKNNF